MCTVGVSSSLLQLIYQIVAWKARSSLSVSLPSLLTYSMRQTPSWETNLFSASKGIPRILRNPKVHCHVNKCPPPAPIQSQINPIHVHIPPSYSSQFDHPNNIMAYKEYHSQDIWICSILRDRVGSYVAPEMKSCENVGIAVFMSVCPPVFR